jgi:hypothetical protein
MLINFEQSEMLETEASLKENGQRQFHSHEILSQIAMCE